MTLFASPEDPTRRPTDDDGGQGRGRGAVGETH